MRHPTWPLSTSLNAHQSPVANHFFSRFFFCALGYDWTGRGTTLGRCHKGRPTRCLSTSSIRGLVHHRRPRTMRGRGAGPPLPSSRGSMWSSACTPLCLASSSPGCRRAFGSTCDEGRCRTPAAHPCGGCAGSRQRQGAARSLAVGVLAGVGAQGAGRRQAQSLAARRDLLPDGRPSALLRCLVAQPVGRSRSPGPVTGDRRRTRARSRAQVCSPLRRYFLKALATLTRVQASSAVARARCSPERFRA
jgi:hypothetical protein